MKATIPSRMVGASRNFLSVVALPLFLSASVYGQALLDFDFAHGTPVTDQYRRLYGVDISAISLAYDVTDDRGITTTIDPDDVAIVFDTEITGPTSDADLQRTGIDPNGWMGGNLSSDYVAGGALILPENNRRNGSGLYSDPDDNLAGGTFSFKIDRGRSYQSFSTVLVDFEEGGTAWDLKIVGRNGVIQELSYSDVLTPGNPFYDSTVESGDNYVSRLPLIDATEYGIDEIAELRLTLNQSSGAIGELVFDRKDAVPEPCSGLMILIGIGGLVLRRKR